MVCFRGSEMKMATQGLLEMQMDFHQELQEGKKHNEIIVITCM